MQIEVKPEEGGYLICAKLVLEDKDDGSGATLEAKYRIRQAEILETLTDPIKTRAVASAMVGRMTTAWKLGLIDAMGSAVVDAVRAAVASPRPED